jgi:hypothetical protein
LRFESDKAPKEGAQRKKHLKFESCSPPLVFVAVGRNKERGAAHRDIVLSRTSRDALSLTHGFHYAFATNVCVHPLFDVQSKSGIFHLPQLMLLARLPVFLAKLSHNSASFLSFISIIIASTFYCFSQRY